jgi:hypothetical protein
MSHDVGPGTPAGPSAPAQPVSPRPQTTARPPRCTARRTGTRPPAPGSACPARRPQDDLSEEDRQWVTRTVASLGPLTDRQRDILGLLLRTRQ